MIVFIYNSLGKKRRKGRNIHRVSYFIITLGFTIVGFYFSLMIKIHEIYKFYYIFLYTYHCWNLICSLKCVWRPPEFDFYNNSGLFISHLCIIVLIKSRASFLLNRKDSFFSTLLKHEPKNVRFDYDWMRHISMWPPTKSSSLS